MGGAPKPHHQSGRGRGRHHYQSRIAKAAAAATTTAADTVSTAVQAGVVASAAGSAAAAALGVQGAGSAAAAAAGGPAMASALAGFQTFGVLAGLSADLVGNASTPEADDVRSADAALGWTTLGARLPWESATDDAAGEARLGARLEELTGVTVVGSALRRLYAREEGFQRACMWAGLALGTLVFLHAPTVFFARMALCLSTRACARRCRSSSARSRSKSSCGRCDGMERSP